MGCRQALRDDPAVRHLAVIVAATTGLFLVNDLFSFLGTTTFAGRDLAGNYAFTWLMEQHIAAGDPFAWTNRWLLGFPAFHLYPPVFFAATAALNLVTGSLLGLAAWFKLVVFASLFLVPAATYLGLRPATAPRQAFFAGVYMLYFLFVYPPVSQVYLVLGTGLVAQGLAFLLLVAAVSLLLHPGRRTTYAAGIALGVTALTHPFVAAAAGTAFAAAYLVTRDRAIIPAIAIAALLTVPWLLQAGTVLPYVTTFTFGTANAGQFVLLLLPLVVAGATTGTTGRILAAAAAATFILATVELPVITQELRFFTYALGFGSMAAGLGAHRVATMLADRYGHHRLAAAALLLPVLVLPLHSTLPEQWRFDGDPSPVYDTLRDRPQGRVLVETSTASMPESFAIQAMLPLRTHHRAVNEVHLDTSPSANYILTLEHWLSGGAIPSPLCRTCNSLPGPERIHDRLDALGVRYVVTRTAAGHRLAAAATDRTTAAGSYRIHTNTNGTALATPLRERPVALIGPWDRWAAVNDRMFTGNVSRPVIWQRRPPVTGVAATVHLNRSTPQVLDRLRAAPRRPLPPATVNATVRAGTVHLTTNTSRPVPVRLKLSYFPGHDAARPVHPARFNTVTTTVPPGGTTLSLH